MEASAPAGGFVNTGEQERSILFERKPKYTCVKGDENTNDSERSRAAGGRSVQISANYTHTQQKESGFPPSVPASISEEALLAFGPDMPLILPFSRQ